ncbi:MAG: LCP family protein [Oscillibacter sp.]|nr:LCP family protein [Oscillibacter sp.]
MSGNTERVPRRRKDTPARAREDETLYSREYALEQRPRKRTPERDRRRRDTESVPRKRAAESTPRKRSTETTPRKRSAEPATRRRDTESTPRKRSTETATRRRAAESTPRKRSAETTTRRRDAESTPRRRSADTTPRKRTTETTRKRATESATRRRSPRKRAAESTPRRRRARRTSPGGLLSRLAIVVLLLLALGKIGDRLVFQELQVVHPDQITADVPPLEEAISQVSDHVAAAAPDRAAQTDRKDGFYTILLAGVDDHNGGSDTVILMSVDSKQHRVFGLSIPRDTKAIVNGKPYKMNAAYKIGGMPLLARTISEQMSIPVDYTVEIDLAGFAAVIDAIGGVDFEVPLDMDYEDPAQNLEIHVAKGLQHLDGETALKVVRFRHNSDGSGYGDEDLGRIRTQQNFLKAAAKRLFSLNSLTKLDDMARIFQQYVKTDLTLLNLVWLAREGLQAGADGIQFATLPGTWKSPYIYTDAQQALAIINEHLNPWQDDRTLTDLKFPA